ncbi:MAG: TonB-dependent receptor [Aliidiomarina sp.]|uniref:TonB-dependent receptor family protein n=1 Tax=Aliidiomarina sp. TaxID=1872439 RepID=UPI0025B87526|nr:TonB-dependent receptor [Aliidiomarina sp.]MCH8502586.1 TonB-dependent receptor [Aliidiomarina sp.]
MTSLFLSPSLFTTLNVVAEETSATEDVIVVTATRSERPWLSTPASIERISVQEQLPGMRTDAAELLIGIAGVQVDTRYNFAQDTRITLRGFGARAAFGVRGVRLRLDGIPLSMPDGQAQTSSILLDEPSQVEVLRGPFAAVYGNSAGGVIDLQSERPRESQLSANLSAGSSARERQHLRGVIADQGETGSTLSFDYARFRTDGDRPNSAVERDQWALRAFHTFSDGMELILRVDDNDAPYLGDPLALSPGQWREDPRQIASQAETFATRKSIRHRQQSLTLRQRSSAMAHLASWQVNAWRGKREIEQYLAFPGSAITQAGGVVDLARSFTGVNAETTWQARRNWRVTTALDYEKQTDERRGFVNDFGQRGDLRRDETGTVESLDGSVISDLQVNERVAWVTGVRYSNLDFAVVDRFIVEGNPDDSGAVRYTEFAWSTGLSYAISPQLSAFIATGEGFETPTLTEMAYQNEGTGLNTDLRAAKLEQHEVGLKWLSATVQGQVTVFQINTRDDLVVDQSLDGRTTYRNAARTEREGLEISGIWRFAQDWSLRTSYTYLNANYGGSEVTSAGNRLPGLAQHELFQQLEWRPLGSERLELLVNARYRSNIATNDANSEFAPSATVWNAAVRSDFVVDNWRVQPWLRLENLTDKTYVGSVVVNQGNGRSFEPAPGRIWMAGVTVTRRF